jgi:hypothetical protein
MCGILFNQIENIHGKSDLILGWSLTSNDFRALLMLKMFKFDVSDDSKEIEMRLRNGHGVKILQITQAQMAAPDSRKDTFLTPDNRQWGPIVSMCHFG